MPNCIHYNEKELLRRMSCNDAAAFEHIYKHYSTGLLCKLLKFLKSNTLAKEALQEVFISLRNNRHKIDSTKSSRLISIVLQQTRGIIYCVKH